MATENPSEQTPDPTPGFQIDRRNLLKLTGAGAAALGAFSLTSQTAFAQYAGTWDKTFPQSDLVDHRKVSYANRLGINLVADMYVPKNIDTARRHPPSSSGIPTAA